MSEKRRDFQRFPGVLRRNEDLELVYENEKVKTQCTSVKAANKLFGGNAMLGRSLLARINALEQAEVIRDIIVQPNFHFHNLENKYGRNLDCNRQITDGKKG